MNKFLSKKALLLISTAAIFLNCTYALEHSAWVTDVKNRENMKMKWSKVKWFSSGTYATALPSKPGPTDTVSVKWGSFSLEIDQDVNVANIHVGDNSDLLSKRHNIRIKRNLGVSMASGNHGTNVKFDSCNIDVGMGISLNFYDRAQSAGFTNIDFIDTNFTAKGDFICIVPANDRFKNKIAKGVTMKLVGKTKMTFGGGIVMDSIFADFPKEWFFKWKFDEKDGKMPSISFAKKVNVSSNLLDVKASSALKDGKYVLIELADRKASLKPKSIVFNGKPYSLGSVVQVGDKSMKIVLNASPISKDTKTANDIILEVGK